VKRYEIYFARLDPVEGSEIGKTRPVVIVSDDLRNQLLQTVVVCPLPMNRQIVGRAARLPPGRLALELSTAGETPGAAGETPAPLLGPSGSGAQCAQEFPPPLRPALPLTPGSPDQYPPST
jgi:PemK-like, MazF-like toxin of type II toxin-antitoxin system